MLFDYLNIPETTSLPAFDFTTTTAVPLWTASNFRTEERQSSVSRPFFCSHSIRFSIRGGHDIHGIIIDYPYNDDPTEPLGEVVKLMETNDILMISRESQGYTKATIFSSLGDTYFANFSWPDEGNDDLSPLLLHKEDVLGVCSLGPFFDEESGRVVLSHSSRLPSTKHNHDVWDFALL